MTSFRARTPFSSSLVRASSKSGFASEGTHRTFSARANENRPSKVRIPVRRPSSRFRSRLEMIEMRMLTRLVTLPVRVSGRSPKSCGSKGASSGGRRESFSIVTIRPRPYNAAISHARSSGVVRPRLAVTDVGAAVESPAYVTPSVGVDAAPTATGGELAAETTLS